MEIVNETAKEVTKEKKVFQHPNRLNQPEIDAVCSAIVTRMLSPDWVTIPTETQQHLINALDKMRKFR